MEEEREREKVKDKLLASSLINVLEPIHGRESMLYGKDDDDVDNN
jgi:hypothetical protein